THARQHRSHRMQAEWSTRNVGLERSIGQCPGPPLTVSGTGTPADPRSCGLAPAGALGGGDAGTPRWLVSDPRAAPFPRAEPMAVVSRSGVGGAGGVSWVNSSSFSRLSFGSP